MAGQEGWEEDVRAGREQERILFVVQLLLTPKEDGRPLAWRRPIA